MITKKTAYAIRAVWELSQNPAQLRTASDIAEAQEIPPKYLPQIVSELVQCGLLNSTRGYKGGLRLKQNPEEISLLNIIEAIQGKIDMFECLNGQVECKHLPDCDLQRVYREAQDALVSVFAETRISDIHLGDLKRGPDA